MKKRIALAAVAALAGGLLVAAPASAVVNGSGWRAPWVLGSTGTITWGVDSTTATVAQVASTGGYVTFVAAADETSTGSVQPFVTVSGSTIKAATGVAGVDTVTVNSASTQATWANYNLEDTTDASVSVYTQAAGTITVTFGALVDVNGVITSTTRQTITINVSAAATSSLYDHSAVATAVASAYVDDNDAVFASKAAGTKVETFTVTQWANAAETTKTAAASTKAITVSATGVGAVAIGNGSASTAGYVAVAAESSNDQVFGIYADGRSGVGTFVISVNGVVVKTLTVTFYGSVASYSVTAKNTALPVSANDHQIFTVKALDSNGIAVPNATIYVTSSDATVATVETATLTSGTSAVDEGASAVAKGSAVFTLADAQLAADITVKATYALTVVKAGVASVALSFDKATYAPGEKATITITGKNADGVLAGDLAYTLFDGGIASSAAFTAALTDNVITLANGVKTYSVYMPLSAGPVSISAKLSTNAALATAIQGTTVAVSAAVVDSAATANAAAITALQTSVATLTTSVASLVASMTAQIKVINATMLKIQKQLAALAAKVAKLK